MKGVTVPPLTSEQDILFAATSTALTLEVASPLICDPGTIFD